MKITLFDLIPNRDKNLKMNNNKEDKNNDREGGSGVGRDNDGRIFRPVNIWMMLGCVGMIILGFALMCGGSSSVESGFNPDIFSTRRIVVGPAIAFLGFLAMAFAIIYTPKKKNQ